MNSIKLIPKGAKVGPTGGPAAALPAGKFNLTVATTFFATRQPSYYLKAEGIILASKSRKGKT
jgi:hypothetical protein